jgi:hypothetical protein
VRIVFLGRSGAGKTTMIASGLAELSARLGLRVAVRDRQRLARTRRAVVRGRRPPRTRGVPTYRSTLPGGARLDCTDHDGRLVDRPLADDRLVAALAVAEALVLVVDATTLTENAAPARVARLAVEVRRRVHALEGDPRPARLPVVLALTRTDRLPASDVRSATALFDPIRAAAGGRVAGITVPVSAGAPEQSVVPLLWCLRHERADPVVEAALIDVWPSGAAHPWTGAPQARTGAAS